MEMEPMKPLIKLKDTAREWEVITDMGKINYILKEYIQLKNLTLKNFEMRPEIFFYQMASDGSYLFKVDPQIQFNVNDHLIVYKTLAKHIEVTLLLQENRSGIIKCAPTEARIARVNRRFERIVMDQNVTAIASNFQVAKDQVDIMKVIGFSGQLIFNELEKDLQETYPRSKICPLSVKTKITEEIEILKLKKKIIYVIDTTTMESFHSDTAFNLKEYYEEDHSLAEKIAHYKTQNIKSFIYYPIFFPTARGNVLIGYIYGDSQEKIPAEIVTEYKNIESKIVKKIMDSNIILMPVKQNIINICENGLLINITDSDLIRSINIKPTFTVDVTFKLQAPLRFSVDVKHIEDTGVSLLVGGEIIGSNDTAKAMELFRSNLYYVNKKSKP